MLILFRSNKLCNSIVLGNKNGNRATMQQSGSGAGIASYLYTYTYDAKGKLTYIKDFARNYMATVASDANGNITSVNAAGAAG